MGFSPVIDFVALGMPVDLNGIRPGALPVLDFSHGPLHEERIPRLAIGRYDEHRPGAYTTPLFTEGHRDIHMGIDLFAPVGTPVHAFTESEVYLADYNAAAGDYGGTIVTRQMFESRELYALYGHLSRRSLEGQTPGRALLGGQVLGWIGDRAENGGWLPHLHFQLSYERPLRADMPGVVNQAQHERARLIFPDPRLVLGPIY